MQYLTYEAIELAKQNGIDYQNAYNRVNNLNWPVEKAITTPIKREKDHLWSKYKALAEQHNIRQSCFYQRVARGISPEEAATTPHADPSYRGKKELKLSKAVVETAARNGISFYTLSARVYQYRWPVERAMTEPVNEKHRRKDLN